jgi:hypothetical protein
MASAASSSPSSGARAAEKQRRKRRPVPEGYQNHIVKDHGYGYSGCFNEVCELLDPASRQPVSEQEQQRIMETSTDTTTQEWCLGENGLDERGEINKYTTFEECCRNYKDRNRDGPMPERCGRLWKQDFAAYAFSLLPPDDTRR